MGKVFKVLLIIVGIGIVAYLGFAIYANTVGFKAEDAKPQLPPSSEAKYIVYIEATREALLTSNYEQIGQVTVLHKYWEQSGKDFIFRDRDLLLDKKIYGEITITKRSATQGGNDGK